MTYKNHLQQNGTQEGQSTTTKDKTSQLEFIKKVQVRKTEKNSCEKMINSLYFVSLSNI
jgi:hypothetical protein